jgi:hypothetical protein
LFAKYAVMPVARNVWQHANARPRILSQLPPVIDAPKQRRLLFIPSTNGIKIRIEVRFSFMVAETSCRRRKRELTPNSRMLYLICTPMKRDTKRIRDELFAVCETMKSTSLSYPNRASILGFLGAAIVANAAGPNVLSYHLDAELRAHLRDALKPLGFTVKRAPGRRAPKYSENS